jgi:hypothetical protein
MYPHASRRQILRSALASTGLGLAVGARLLLRNVTIVMNGLSDRRRGHISNRVHRNALIWSSLQRR